ncbi:MAG: M55 family metallopeptidase [Clostridia bacterium]|nr:M55 family metallopeptidase [Clostridia bacterium]
MNIYIMVDLEGISGLYAREQMTPDASRFSEARRYMTREVNLCARACREAGADKIYVRDGHGGSYTLIWDQLSSDVDYAVCGITGDVRYPGLENCDAVILLGYHAMAGTRGGLLEHTMSSKTVQNYWLNDVRIGEVELDAAILADYQKPVIMVSGDTAVCEEAKAFLPWVETAEVKKSIACFGSMLLPPARAEAVLTEAVTRAIANFKNGKVGHYKVESPVRLRAEYVERTQLPTPAAKPYMTVIDGRTVEVTGESAEEALFRLW